MPELPVYHEHFAPLRGAEFMVLTTYRRTGAAVPTTVWFAEAEGVLYLTTAAEAGKVKRLRVNPEVQVAPSDRVGNIQGPALPARARVLEPHEDAVAIAALRQKYGALFTTLTAQMDAARPAGSRIYVVITT
ncbi:MAG: PPOX class F420-dependent oxidoreductase [Chloroflexales bacterium]|nr:PPOX class F420-dependent oxidoreductase [Chloroflexales bacterium]